MLTQDEADIYDRQIRLWGVNSQRKIRQSRVLMLSCNGSASEVAKILVLAGIDVLTIIDDKFFQKEDLTSNLFCRPNFNEHELSFRTHAVVDKLKTLNPLVKVSVRNTSISDIAIDHLRGFDLVTLHSFLPIEQTSKLNDMCRSLGIKFYIALDFGLFGFTFSDLGSSYSFVSEKRENINDSQVELERGTSECESISIDYAGVDIDRKAALAQPNRKRPRLNSDGDIKTKLSSKQAAELKENEESVTLSFIPFSEMITLKQDSINERTSPVLVIAVALYTFCSRFGPYRHTAHDPHNEQVDLLNEIIAKIIPQKTREKILKKLDEDWFEKLSGSFSPVCAVVGGVAGQDMIRVLSGRDVPLHNTFTFDALNMVGLVNKVNLDETQTKGKKRLPVIESLDIDDD